MKEPETLKEAWKETWKGLKCFLFHKRYRTKTYTNPMGLKVWTVIHCKKCKEEWLC